MRMLNLFSNNVKSLFSSEKFFSQRYFVFININIDYCFLGL